ncbi:hypothetical protein Cgig2_024263 [Carnegiea gigantea]|uniref:F-box domain-containing protein n=1 Tax=Carnegiea gigantea TaxID=171969 RepID=A0A9Q1GIS9_9CARY|nr:hypothetical protein Cgig2_024263 [Carnegiea gigantea]
MISDLPKNVIDNIIQFLSVVDAVRMRVLSESWRHPLQQLLGIAANHGPPMIEEGEASLSYGQKRARTSNWASPSLVMPLDRAQNSFFTQLVFDWKFAYVLKNNAADEEDELDAYKWSSITSNMLLLHEGSMIKFSLTIPPWTSHVSKNGVKSLTLLNHNTEFPFRLPSYLFSRVPLEHLSLLSCSIGHFPYFTGLRNLLSLVSYIFVFVSSKVLANRGISRILPTTTFKHMKVFKFLWTELMTWMSFYVSLA